MTNVNDLEIPKAPNNYLKLDEGTTKVRILSDFIDGYLDREDKKPLRYRKGDCPEKAISENGFSYYRDCVVRSYDQKKIMVWEIKSKTIMVKIKTLAQDADWGDNMDYDLKISKTGQKMDTKYDVVPTNKSDTPADITQAYLDANVNLEVLYDGGDPFSDIKKPF